MKEGRRLKGIGKGVVGSLLRPYSYAAKGLFRSGQNIKNDAQTLLDTIKKGKDKSNVVYMNAPNPKAAFEMLFKENEWSDEALTKQRRLLRRSKWIMMGGAWVSFMAFLYFLTKTIEGLLHGGAFLMHSYCAMVFVLSGILFIVNSLKNAVFQEQIEKRDLITLKRFISEGELIRKFLS